MLPGTSDLIPNFNGAPHVGKGGGRGGMHPPEGQKQVPSPAPEKWVPITKSPWSLLLYTPFFGFFYFACLFFQVAVISKGLKKSFFI